MQGKRASREIQALTEGREIFFWYHWVFDSESIMVFVSESKIFRTHLHLGTNNLASISVTHMFEDPIRIFLLSHIMLVVRHSRSPARSQRGDLTLSAYRSYHLILIKFNIKDLIAFIIIKNIFHEWLKH
jgi:hypothetical protein